MSTKDRIIEYTVKMIKLKGYSAFSYENIAQKLKITKAAVHHYFEKKEDLAIAVCDYLQVKIIEAYERNLKQNKHPWNFIQERINTIKPREICPISSLQGDFDQFSIKLKKTLIETTNMEIDYFLLLIRHYSGKLTDDSVALSFYMSIKGALQYRRVLGEVFYENYIESVKTQFYNFLEKKE